VPWGREVVVIDRGMALIVNVRDFSIVNNVASRKVKVCVALLITVGVSLITPLGSRVRPLGRGVEPLLRLHV